MADSYRNIIGAAGEDVDREGLVDTPLRAAKAFAFFTKVCTLCYPNKRGKRLLELKPRSRNL